MIRLLKLGLISALLLACNKQNCLKTANGVLDLKADRLCPLDQPWDDCPYAKTLEAEAAAVAQICQEIN